MHQIYIRRKPWKIEGPGDLKRVLVWTKRGEERGQHHTPIFVIFFLNSVT